MSNFEYLVAGDLYDLLSSTTNFNMDPKKFYKTTDINRVLKFLDEIPDENIDSDDDEDDDIGDLVIDGAKYVVSGKALSTRISDEVEQHELESLLHLDTDVNEVCSSCHTTFYT